MAGIALPVDGGKLYNLYLIFTRLFIYSVFDLVKEV